MACQMDFRTACDASLSSCRLPPCLVLSRGALFGGLGVDSWLPLVVWLSCVGLGASVGMPPPLLEEKVSNLKGAEFAIRASMLKKGRYGELPVPRGSQAMHPKPKSGFIWP